jgi:hypothetical protein
MRVIGTAASFAEHDGHDDVRMKKTGVPGMGNRAGVAQVPMNGR